MIVPVLSKATVRTAASRSRVPAFLMMTPLRAARLIPPRNATGAAISSGQGVATTSTSAKTTGSPWYHHASPATRRANAVKGTA